MSWTPKETGIAECGDVSWKLEMADGSDLDTTLFTTVDFSTKTKTLVIYSVDLSKIDIYDMKVTV